MKKPADLTTSDVQKAELARLLSGGRMNSYTAAVDAAAGSKHSELDVYVYNMALSAALLGPLHMLEVITRNSMHMALKKQFKQDDWWNARGVNLLEMQDDALTSVEKKLKEREFKEGYPPATADDIVAALDFGFWCGILGKGRTGDSSYDYERTLWQPALRHAFPQWRGQRDVLARKMHAARTLRNRVGHHEPVHQRRIEQDYKNLIDVIMYVSKPVSTWVDDRSLVPYIYNQRPGQQIVVTHF